MARLFAAALCLVAVPGCMRVGLQRLPDDGHGDTGPNQDADTLSPGDGGPDSELDADPDAAPTDGDARDADADAEVDADDAGPDAHVTPEDMRYVPAGTFMMGCNDSVDGRCDDDERPYHEVYLDAFEIDATEVTQAAFAECVTAGECTQPADDYSPAGTPLRPVVHVTRDQAIAYCVWVGRRLPTEAEWEKAARGTDGRVYPWGNTDPDCSMINYDLCVGNPVDVGSYPASDSPWGVHDMAGNASKWVSDWYDEDYFARSPAANPPGPASGSSGGTRGSSYYYGLQSVRTSNRIEAALDVVNGGRGFRCAVSAP